VGEWYGSSEGKRYKALRLTAKKEFGTARKKVAVRKKEGGGATMEFKPEVECLWG